MHVIYKGHGSRTSVDAYRGITVLNIDAKVYVMLSSDASTWTWRSGCMMHNTASVAAGAPQTASSTYAGWWSATPNACCLCGLQQGL